MIKNKMKRMISVLISLAVLWSIPGMAALTAGADTGELNMADGTVNFSWDNTNTRWQYVQNSQPAVPVLNNTQDVPLVITGTSNINTILVDGTDSGGQWLYLELRDVSLNQASNNTPFEIKNDGHVNLLLSGNNQLNTSYTSAAALQVEAGNAVCIRAKTGNTDTLTAYSSRGAGIGGGSGIVGNDCGTVEIQSGKIIAQSTSSSGIGGGSGNNTTTGTSKGGDGGTVIISGGIVEATSTNGTGIGGGNASAGNDSANGGSGGTVTISDGRVTATGVGGAGIGGGSGFARGIGTGGNGGTVEIRGGIVEATSTNGAGIGGGEGNGSSADGGSNGRVIISGGVVIAKSRDGAGIGGGKNYASGGAGRAGAGGTVEIEGGVVQATSTNGAGIGGGWGHNPSSGTGNGGNGGTVTISGGTVAAHSTEGKSAGIGGASGRGSVVTTGTSGEVFITGGSVTFSGGEGGVQSQPKKAGGTQVYKTTLILAPATPQTAVTQGNIGRLMLGSAEYGMKDVQTDADSKLYFWLEQRAEQDASITAGGNRYLGKVDTKADNTSAATLAMFGTDPNNASGGTLEDVSTTKEILDAFGGGVQVSGSSPRTIKLTTNIVLKDTINFFNCNTNGFILDLNGFDLTGDLSDNILLFYTARSKGAIQDSKGGGKIHNTSGTSLGVHYGGILTINSGSMYGGNFNSRAYPAIQVGETSQLIVAGGDFFAGFIDNRLAYSISAIDSAQVNLATKRETYMEGLLMNHSSVLTVAGDQLWTEVDTYPLTWRSLPTNSANWSGDNPFFDAQGTVELNVRLKPVTAVQESFEQTDDEYDSVVIIQNPPTGDQSQLLSWVVLLVAGCAGIAVCRKNRHRK